MKQTINALAFVGLVALVYMLWGLYAKWRARQLPAMVVIDEDRILLENGLDSRRGRVLRGAIRYRNAVEASAGLTPWTGWAAQVELARTLAAAAAVETDAALEARKAFAVVPREQIDALKTAVPDLGRELEVSQAAFALLLAPTPPAPEPLPAVTNPLVPTVNGSLRLFR